MRIPPQAITWTDPVQCTDSVSQAADRVAALNVNVVDGDTTITPVVLQHNLYRLTSAVVGTATDHWNTNGTGTDGDTVTIPAGFKALNLHYNRETAGDPGDGSVAEVEVNGIVYRPGAGPAGYYEALPDFNVGDGETYSQPVTITVRGSAFVEVRETREA